MSDQFHVATRKGLFTITRTGATWRVSSVAFLSDPVTAVLLDPRDGARYVALNHGHFGVKMHRSRDGGATWQECAAPAYPTQPEGEDVDWKVRQLWSLEAGHADEPGVLWCGTIPGGLFRSPDGGDSWELVRSLWDHPKRKGWMGGGYDQAGIHSICVDPRDARRIAVGVSIGGVWLSEDGAESWTNRSQGMRAEYMPPEKAFDLDVQDPHRVVQCPGAPDHWWSQHHNGIFRSTDDAHSWAEVTNVRPSAFGFAVAVHPHEPETAWFVPAAKDENRIPVDGKVVVNRTRDGGQTMETLSEGLPQEHAYDLVYRHALDVDSSGDRLAFGSTTGALWVSDDQGDRWALVSAHLPPIYCVRFAP